jgi:PEP-CTERM motif
MQTSTISIAAALLLTALGTGVQAQNLITNGDFERSPVATDSFQTYTNLGGYTSTLWGSDSTSGTHKIVDVSGNQFMQFGGGDSAYTAFGVAASGDYLLSFDFDGSGFFDIYNQDTSSYLMPGPVFQFNGSGTESGLLTLTGGTNYKMYFGAIGAGLPGYTSSMNLDNVSLTAVTPVPEPEGYAMLMAGLGVLGFMARRRQQR